MKVVGILTLVGSVLFTNVSSADVYGFKILPWQDCTDKAVCKTVKPKNWKSKEASALSSILASYVNGGLSPVLAKIQSDGYLSFERLKNSFRMIRTSSGSRPEVNLDTVAFTRVGNAHRTIAITDRYFNDNIDPFTQVKMKNILLLHEIAHAYDHDFKISQSAEFLDLAGFNSQNKFVKGSPETLHEGNMKYISAQVVNNNPTKAMRIQREYGMKFGLPRIYSTGSPFEAFADLVAFIYYDRSASRYISPKLMQFIDAKILKGQRAK